MAHAIGELLNIESLRQETPGCAHVVHFNNAGASLMPLPVLEAVTNYLNLEADIGGYEAAYRLEEAVEHTYDAVASLIHCKRQEVAIVENATRAWDMAFYAIPFQPGDRILTAQSEYASNFIAYLQVAKRQGVQVDVIPNEPSGELSLSALESMIDDRVKLISITHIPTNNGLINPAKGVGEIAKRHNILYLLDACQSVGQMPINVQEIGCHILSATGRKYLRGPRGTGFLYVNEAWIDYLEPPMLDLHAASWKESHRFVIRPDARRFENWETFYAGKVGLGVAIDYAHQLNMAETWSRIKELSSVMRQELKGLPHVHLQDMGREQCGLVTFTMDNVEPKDLVKKMNAEGINLSYSPEGYTLLDMRDRGLKGVVRASVHYFNTIEEINLLVEALRTFP